MARMSSAGASHQPDAPIGRTDSFDRQEQLAAEGLYAVDGSDVDAAIMEERRKELAAIEKDTLVLKDLFLDMKDLVDEQQEAVDEVETNVEVAQERVEKGVVDLKKASDYRMAYRKKMLCCAVIGITLLAIIGLIIGLQFAGGGTATTPCVKDVNGTCP